VAGDPGGIPGGIRGHLTQLETPQPFAMACLGGGGSLMVACGGPVSPERLRTRGLEHLTLICTA
jgi:hypothetical protein